ncbi:MAG: hypothetical protein ACK41C_11480 [Phenylobacterium sp.]|uniref:hypothetical protein n=1 Tax=Phenylobacterium sp. TaxID=1871053 RepID=UPI00391D0E0B
MTRRPHGVRTGLLMSVAAALVLGGCREEAQPAGGYGLPPSAFAYDAAPAPEALALPPAPPAPVAAYGPDMGYGWAERAYAMERAFYDAPPDYGFYYDDVQPWVWETQDHWALYAEPVTDGYRYYYYEPGAAHPYFVRDPYYGYGYDDAGRLVTLVTLAGVLLPQSHLERRADVAGRYWTRARSLRQAARVRTVSVREEAWLARRPAIVRTQTPWIQAAARQEDWRRHRERHGAREVRRFEPERTLRQAQVAELRRAELSRIAPERREDRGDRRRGRDDRTNLAAAPPPQRIAPQRSEVRPERPERRERVAAPAREPRPTRAPEARDGRPARAELRETPRHEARPERPASRPERAERPLRPAEARSERPRAHRAEQSRQQPPAQREARARQEARPERARAERAERPRQPRQAEREVRARGGARAEAPAERPQRAEARNAGQGGRDAAAREGRPERPDRARPERAERPGRGRD